MPVFPEPAINRQRNSESVGVTDSPGKTDPSFEIGRYSDAGRDTNGRLRSPAASSRFRDCWGTEFLRIKLRATEEKEEDRSRRSEMIFRDDFQGNFLRRFSKI